jgi:hypothetical protein
VCGWLALVARHRRIRQEQPTGQCGGRYATYTTRGRGRRVSRVRRRRSGDVVGACRALLCVNKVCQRRGLLSRIFKWRYLPERGATRPAAVSDGGRGGENRPPSPRRQPARRRLLGASRDGKVFVYRLRIIRRYITVYHQTIQPARAHRAHCSVLRFSDTSASRSPCTFRRSFTVLPARAPAEWTGVVPAHNSLILMACCD